MKIEKSTWGAIAAFIVILLLAILCNGCRAILYDIKRTDFHKPAEFHVLYYELDDELNTNDSTYLNIFE